MSKNIFNVRFADKCPKCNTYFRTPMEICPNCGIEINEEEVSNEMDLSSETFGDEDFITCPSCRVLNSLMEQKCQTCGQKLLETKEFRSAK